MLGPVLWSAVCLVHAITRLFMEFRNQDFNYCTSIVSMALNRLAHCSCNRFPWNYVLPSWQHLAGSIPCPGEDVTDMWPFNCYKMVSSHCCNPAVPYPCYHACIWDLTPSQNNTVHIAGMCHYSVCFTGHNWRTCIRVSSLGISSVLDLSDRLLIFIWGHLLCRWPPFPQIMTSLCIRQNDRSAATVE